MRIAVVCPYAIDRPGGVQGQASQMVQWLREAGHDAWLVAPGHDGGPEGTVYLGRPIDVRGNGAVAPISIKPIMQRRLNRAVASADVVHIHEPLIPMVSLNTLRADTPPKLGTFHADTGKFASSVYWIARPLLRQWAKRLAAATAVSNIAATAVQDLVDGLRIIPNGIDVASYARDVPRDPSRVVFVGRDDVRKGLDVILEAWPSIRWHAPGAELVVLGSEREPRPGVTFRGPVLEEEKRRCIAGAAVLVAPNLYGESFGLILIEGMAAGCAVVASALPAFKSVLDNTGMLVPPGDSATLAVAVTRTLLDEPLRQRLVEAERRRVQRFDRSRVLTEYLHAYEGAIEDSARAAPPRPSRRYGR